MKIYHECIPCLARQAVEVAELMTDKKEIQREIIRKALAEISAIGFEETAPYLARTMHLIAKEITGIQDPYKDLKFEYNKIAENLYCELNLEERVACSDYPFDTACRLSIAGNIIDFALGLTLERQGIYDSIQLSLEAEIVGNSSQELKKAVDKASKILVISDNSGEIVFDKLLIKQLPADKTIYSVKGAPIVNEATMEDAIAVGMTKLVKVIDNGAESQGTILKLCSKEFIKTFTEADLIISKGQANYETLSHLNDPRIFFLLRAKCKLIADDLNCQQGDFVIKQIKEKP